MNKVRTILMGTSEFAAGVFEKAYFELKNRLEIITVITAPDKPVGRKQELTPSPVKKWALELNFSVLEPIKIRDIEWIDKVKSLNPDLIILCAYGQIIPKEILDIPKYGALNIHPSLLPKYRGASPIHAAILNGDKETGTTLMVMDEKMDHGDIVASAKLQITNSQTFKKLSDGLAKLSTDLLIKTLPNYIDGKIKPKPQDHSKATFCKLIKKENGKIDWNKPAQEIERQIRAFHIWPGTYTFFNNKQLKILEADPSTSLPSSRGAGGANKKVGEVFLTDDKQLVVQTRNGVLVLKQVHLEGKKPMSAQDFLNGHSEIIGMILI